MLATGTSPRTCILWTNLGRQRDGEVQSSDGQRITTFVGYFSSSSIMDLWLHSESHPSIIRDLRTQVLHAKCVLPLHARVPVRVEPVAFKVDRAIHGAPGFGI